MAANHTSISSYMSPSNGLGDGKGWGAVKGVCVTGTGAAWVDFSFLGLSPLTVTTVYFIVVFIHLGSTEPQRAGRRTVNNALYTTVSLNPLSVHYTTHSADDALGLFRSQRRGRDL